MPSDPEFRSPGHHHHDLRGPTASRLAIRGLRELSARARADLKIPFTPVGPDFRGGIGIEGPRIDPDVGIAPGF